VRVAKQKSGSSAGAAPPLSALPAWLHGFGAAPRKVAGVAASKPEKETIMNDNTGKKRPDFIAYTVRSQNAGPHYTRIGVGSSQERRHQRPLRRRTAFRPDRPAGHRHRREPATISYGSPPETQLRREHGAGCRRQRLLDGDRSAWRQDGYVSIQLDVVPLGGKIILTQPREQA